MEEDGHREISEREADVLAVLAVLGLKVLALLAAHRRRQQREPSLGQHLQRRTQRHAGCENAGPREESLTGAGRSVPTWLVQGPQLRMILSYSTVSPASVTTSFFSMSIVATVVSRITSTPSASMRSERISSAVEARISAPPSVSTACPHGYCWRSWKNATQ